MVYLCLNIITSTFQPLRRPPELQHGDAASLSSEGAAEGRTAVVHSRHLRGSVDESLKVDRKEPHSVSHQLLFPFQLFQSTESGVKV